jgi:hypothetical protein
MKTILYSKTSGQAFQVQVRVDIVSTLAKMQEPGFEIMCTIMETQGLTDEAISQGLDVTKKTERSYQDLIALGDAIAGTTVTVIDLDSNASFVAATP